jgi:hypothetical protein
MKLRRSVNFAFSLTVARWYICIPNITIWVEGLEMENGGLVFGLLEYFTAL